MNEDGFEDEALAACRRYSCAAWDDLDESWRAPPPACARETACCSPWVRTALAQLPQRLHVAEALLVADRGFRRPAPVAPGRLAALAELLRRLPPPALVTVARSHDRYAPVAAVPEAEQQVYELLWDVYPSLSRTVRYGSATSSLRVLVDALA